MARYEPAYPSALEELPQQSPVVPAVVVSRASLPVERALEQEPRRMISQQSAWLRVRLASFPVQTFYQRQNFLRQHRSKSRHPGEPRQSRRLFLL